MKRRTVLALCLSLGALLLATPAAAQNKPVVRIETSLGVIRAELYPDKAPATVANFLQYAKDKHYHGTIFHRVIRGFMIQGGGYTPDYKKKATREPVRNEGDNGLLNEVGTLVMARTPNPHSATAQFFINAKKNDFLNHRSKDSPSAWGYCVFGKVIEGMEVVRAIESTETGPAGPFAKDAPKTPVVIKAITVEAAGAAGK